MLTLSLIKAKPYWWSDKGIHSTAWQLVFPWQYSNSVADSCWCHTIVKMDQLASLWARQTIISSSCSQSSLSETNLYVSYLKQDWWHAPRIGQFIHFPQTTLEWWYLDILCPLAIHTFVSVTVLLFWLTSSSLISHLIHVLDSNMKRINRCLKR